MASQDDAQAPGIRSTCISCAGLVIEQANQVWLMDITYIAMARGFVYLAAVVHWLRAGCSLTADLDGHRVLPRSAGRGLGSLNGCPSSSSPIKAAS